MNDAAVVLLVFLLGLLVGYCSRSTDRLNCKYWKKIQIGDRVFEFGAETLDELQIIEDRYVANI